MAERGYTPINVVRVFDKIHLSAGDSSTAGPIDLRELAQQGMFALSFAMAAGTAGSCGTTAFTYTESSTLEGTYVSPLNSIAIGTAGIGGTSKLTNIVTFEPEMMPFMKIIATQTGAGTAGKDNIITADLIVQ
jgi:hypothetical protein